MTISLENRFQKFIENILCPSKHEIDKIASKTRKLEHIMRNNTGLKIAETLYGGSFAKSTMLKGRNEADLVFILSSKYPEKKIDQLRDDLITFFNPIENITNIQVNYRSLSFNYDGVDIDLLVAKSVSKPDSFTKMSEKQKRRFSPSSSKFHVSFVKSKGAKFQNLVRLLKYWIKMYPERLCSSFFLELIAAIVYDEQTDASYPDLFTDTIKWIEEKQLKVSIAFDYTDQYAVQKKSTNSGFIADPGDSSNNILDGMNNKEKLIDYAKVTHKRIKAEKWEEIFDPEFPNEEGIIRKKAKKRERQSQHPSDAPNRRYG